MKASPAMSGLTKPIPGDLYSFPDAAALARISIHTLYHWKRQKRINVYGRPGYYRVSLAEILPISTEADPAHYAHVSKRGPKRKQPIPKRQIAADARKKG